MVPVAYCGMERWQMANEEDSVSRVVRGVRLDLAIAVCALLISTLAAGASWWQARVLQAQTRVLQEQLGAQVWPYVSVTEGINGDTVAIDVSNEGLGPAVMRSFSAVVDGVPRSGFIEILHALLGPNIVARKPHGEKMAFTIDTGGVGVVIRPGDKGLGFSLTSKHFAQQLLAGYRRTNFRVCYCAIIPGKCWLNDSAVTREPVTVSACPEIPNDLLHARAAAEVMERNF